MSLASLNIPFSIISKPRLHIKEEAEMNTKCHIKKMKKEDFTVKFLFFIYFFILIEYRETH